MNYTDGATNEIQTVMKSVTDLPSSTSNINSLQIKTKFISATINKFHTI